ncbi:MAG: hypothetical protein KAY32_10960 [Candidatus Eisenbacteria sp.]|nr:hypothetical protein [Candidatus Eisenbacteria bacterium]
MNMPLSRRSLAFLLGIGLVAAVPLGLVTGCQDENQPRSRVRIVQIMGAEDSEDLAGSVFQSDVLDAGQDGIPGTADDGVVEDELLVAVENRPSSTSLVLEPDGPFGSVVITHYRVTFAIAGEQLDPVEGALQLIVPTGSERVAGIVAVTALAKTQPPLSTLAAIGGELFATATLTLTGYEETSEDEVSASASFQVHFADWAEEEDD